jgi:hypothetical protein
MRSTDGVFTLAWVIKIQDWSILSERFCQYKFARIFCVNGTGSDKYRHRTTTTTVINLAGSGSIIGLN